MWRRSIGCVVGAAAGVIGTATYIGLSDNNNNVFKSNPFVRKALSARPVPASLGPGMLPMPNPAAKWDHNWDRLVGDIKKQSFVS